MEIIFPVGNRSSNSPWYEIVVLPYKSWIIETENGFMEPKNTLRFLEVILHPNLSSDVRGLDPSTNGSPIFIGLNLRRALRSHRIDKLPIQSPAGHPRIIR